MKVYQVSWFYPKYSRDGGEAISGTGQKLFLKPEGAKAFMDQLEAATRLIGMVAAITISELAVEG